MSSNGRGRGRGRGRGQIADDDTKNDVSEMSFSPPIITDDKPRKAKNQSKSIDDIKRNMSDAKSRVELIIDTLDGDDIDPATLKRSVAFALKHLKLVHTMLDP